jgi:hypothetical protein
MRLTAWILAGLAALSLAGCYESKSMLLDASAARQPISAYQDWRYGSGESRWHAQLTPRGDGWYNYDEAKIKDDGSEGDWEHYTVLLNYLERVDDNDIYVYGTWDDSLDAYLYGLVVMKPGGGWQSIRPSCDPIEASEQWFESDVAAAREAGAEIVSTDEEDACRFTDRGTLFQAMRNLVDRPRFWDRVDKAGS